MHAWIPLAGAGVEHAVQPCGPQPLLGAGREQMPPHTFSPAEHEPAVPPCGGDPPFGLPPITGGAPPVTAGAPPVTAGAPPVIGRAPPVGAKPPFDGNPPGGGRPPVAKPPAPGSAPKPPAPVPVSGTAPSSKGFIAPPRVAPEGMDSLVAQAEPARANKKTAVEVRMLTPQPDAATMKHTLF